MDVATFNKEDKKYSDLWVNGYKDANWLRLAKEILKRVKIPNSSLIDFGFGRGTALNYFEKKGFTIEGTEISSYVINKQSEKGRIVYHTSLDNLHMLKENQFEIGFCNDVIEHIPEKLVIPSLEEMTRICSNYLFISVCPTPSHHLSLEGENLHLTVHPKKWWETQFKKYGKIEKLKFLFSRSLRYVINVKPEKRL